MSDACNRTFCATASRPHLREVHQVPVTLGEEAFLATRSRSADAAMGQFAVDDTA